MLDKSIPYYPVIMVKSLQTAYPRYSLPNGYKFVPYNNGLEKEWATLQYETGQIESLDAAMHRFKKEYLPLLELAKKNCWFVCVEKTNEIVATASLWRGNHFGIQLDRIHWVAVKNNYNGKGLAKALLTKVLERSHSEIIYLTTQTWSYPAICLYFKFGFSAYLGSKPIYWEQSDYETNREIAWKIIKRKLVDKGV